jgi:hypothetical protein
MARRELECKIGTEVFCRVGVARGRNCAGERNEDDTQEGRNHLAPHLPFASSNPVRSRTTPSPPFSSFARSSIEITVFVCRAALIKT